MVEESPWFAQGDGSHDPRPGWFAAGGVLDGVPPSARVLGALEALAAAPAAVPTRDSAGVPRFAGATHDEAAGMLAAVQALEGHVAGLKLAAVREIIRFHAPAVPGGRMPDPTAWDIGVLHEVAAILRISVQSAGPVVELAWQLEARLPGVGGLLDAGVLSPLTAKIIAEELSVLDDGAVAEAEKRLLDHDLSADDMTPGKIRRLCQRLADTVDPEGAARRREQKERDEARVRFYRAHGGAGALFACGLPADEALRSEANVQKRALEYKAAGIREKMDFLRVLALCDLANGLSVPGRLARWRAEQAEEQAEEAARRRYGDGAPFPDSEPGDLDGQDGVGGGVGLGGGANGPGGAGGGPGEGGGGGAGPVPAGVPDPGLPSLVNMTVPLATVLGQADRPGEAPGYGSLDPALARRLAGAAAQSARSEFCVTFTDEDGHAAAHGCARLIRGTGDDTRNGRDGPPGTGWDFARDTARPGPAGGYGSWILRLPASNRLPASSQSGDGRPAGRQYRVEMHKVPLHDCDHTYATSAYRPGDLLRHLVQVRDGECTFTGCSRPARESDFEHAVPYHQGGATDACNAGMRSRSCHKVKQSPGWNVTQPEPGWHVWTTPSGRGYTKGPKDYPA